MAELNTYLTPKDFFEMNFRETLEANHGQMNYMIVIVQLPTGALEMIANTQNFEEKLDYYLNAYTEDLCLKNNPQIMIIKYLFV